MIFLPNSKNLEGKFSGVVSLFLYQSPFSIHHSALSPLKNPSWMSPANFWKYQTSSAPTLLIKHPGNHFSICLCMSPWKYCRSQSLVVFCSYTYENIGGPQMCLSEKKSNLQTLPLDEGEVSKVWSSKLGLWKPKVNEHDQNILANISKLSIFLFCPYGQLFS